jgi:acyl-CoA synthetase (AMP-forming)/AMP-acid ligase II
MAGEDEPIIPRMILRSRWPEVEIPDLPLTPYVFEHLDRRTSVPAMVEGPTGRTISYGALYRDIRRFARGLADRGFRKRDVFALYLPNVPEYPVAFHGVASAGGASTTINPLYTAGELHKQLIDSRARFLLTMPPFLQCAKDGAKDTTVEEIFVLGGTDLATPYEALLANDGDAPDVAIDPAEDLVALPYSSGTTGLNKGVMLTHRNLVANLAQVQSVFCDDTREGDVGVGLLPFFHIYALMVILNLNLRNGTTTVTIPRFEMEQFLKILSAFRVTFAHVVPPIVLALSKHPLVDQYDLSSLRWILSGAAPLGSDLAESCARRLNCRVIQGYGLTETSPCTHVSPPDERNRPGTIGQLVPNTECKIVDASTGQVLEPGQDGELWIRGPQVMKGYLNNPGATAAVIDAEGFFHTGDIGHVDADGYFRIVDRLKELIKYKGLQVAPAELEAVLLSHHAVADAAVIPIPDPEAGEVPKAFIVKRAEVSANELMTWVAERVAPYKKVRAVEMVDQIPKSASGKILRRVLVERERETRSRLERS